MNAPKHKNLQDIEDRDWGEPADAASVVRTVRELRRKPVGELAADELALLLRQQVGLPTLVPRALDLLEVDHAPPAETSAGELMLAVMACDANRWHDAPSIRRRLVALIDKAHASKRKHLDALVEGASGRPERDIHANDLKKMHAWAAYADERTARQRRRQAQELRDCG